MKTTKYQDGGRTMREKAAVRKDEKGKGMYVPVDGHRKTKGLYVGYNKAGRKEVKETGGTEVYNLKPTRRVMQDGGKVTRGDIRDAQRAAKLKRIEAGTEPSTYEKVANISGNVAKTAVAAGETAKAVRDTRTGMSGPGGMQKGGATKKYQDGGRVISAKAAERKSAKGKGFTSSVMGPNPSGNKGEYVPFTRQGRKDAKETGRVSLNEMKPARKIMKTGGMVNSNAKVSASKKATGKVGGTSSAPKTAVPKAKMGGAMKRKSC